MKLGRIKAACKANHICFIIQDTEAAQQWICNGEAAYKLEGVWVDEQSIRAIWDIPPKTWEDSWQHDVFEVSELAPEKAEMLAAVWESQQEIELEPCDIRILWRDEYRRFKTPDGKSVYAVSLDFDPLSGNGRYALRTAPGCDPVIAVYDDLLCQGVVAALTPGAAKALNDRLREYANAEVYCG